MKFKAWPVDEGDMGIRLDVDTERRCDLPPCPGEGGWKGQNGAWWTRIVGPTAAALARRLSGTPDGFYQDVIIEMDGDKVVSILPA